MSSPRPFPAYACSRLVALHSLGWLVAANLVGLWLGLTLLWPALGSLLAPLTWGRWAPVHMNWQLYGWCALPWVGALFAWFLDQRASGATIHARWALRAWSLALLVGGVAWLGGLVSGKLFLDWHGWTRAALPAAMLLLWAVLAWHTRLRWRGLSSRDKVARAGWLALLVAIPPVLFWATGRTMYHPVNPDSGGATGAAVLGSTLGIITLFMWLPRFLGVGLHRTNSRFWWMLAASWLVFAMLDRGNVSHHGLAPIAALGTLLLWIPLLPWYWSLQEWPSEARPWLRAAAVWWTVLVISGWLSFLPGLSEALKFTHALVGHAHLAMAGLLTTVNAAVLVVLQRRSAPRGVYPAWQVGCAVYVGSMLALGWGEIDRAGELFRSEAWTQILLALRLAGGAAMAGSSLRWGWVVWRGRPGDEVGHG